MLSSPHSFVHRTIGSRNDLLSLCLYYPHDGLADSAQHAMLTDTSESEAREGATVTFVASQEP